jgi:hypothetical protein
VDQLSPILAFYGKARFDVRLLPLHQSLYLALFFFVAAKRLHRPFHRQPERAHANGPVAAFCHLP